MIFTEDEYLAHSGTPQQRDFDPKGSGRYRQGSGKTPHQHEPWFKWSRQEDYQERAKMIKEFLNEGYTEQEIATGLGIKRSDVKNFASIASKAERTRNMALAREIRDSMAAKGDLKPSATEIARIMSQQLGKKIGESTVRGYLDEGRVDREQEMDNIVSALQKTVKKKKYVDVGKGTEACLNITSSKLDQALFILKEQGYNVYSFKIEQLGTGHNTNMLVLTAPGTTYSDLSKHRGDIKPVEDYTISEDGKTLFGIEYPAVLDSSRVAVRYAEDDGKLKDGVMEIRRGVEDLSLGNSSYAQVRINVDNTHYLKGVAVYSDDLPDGVDIVFNTNKSKDVPMLGPKDNSVLKPLKRDKLTGEIDKDNPFGAQIKSNQYAENVGEEDKDSSAIKANGQYHYLDKDGNYKLSPINKVSEEGDWDRWSRTLPTQFLSKQPLPLVKEQLNMAMEKKKAEFKDIQKLTNPAIKQQLLLEFADSCDSDAVEMRGHSLPGQRTQLLLPLTTLKSNEIYAPNFNNGETVALIRFPHAGTFEIPVVKVNNNNREGKKVIGSHALDAIGVSQEVAQQLSGADFDGDTAVVLPMERGKGYLIKAEKAQKELQEFDPGVSYPYREGMKVMDHRTTQLEMGKISNLITDMTMMHAPLSDVIPAVKYSMVVIDAEKHKYDYTQAFKDFNIAALNKKYRGRANAGAGTLISRAKSEARVPERKDYYKIDPDTGEKIYMESGRTYRKFDKDTMEYVGEPKEAKQKVSKMSLYGPEALVSDAKYPVELVYAKHARELIEMGKQARILYANTPNLTYSPSAAKVYAKEVASLNAKLNEAYKNAPKERLAQVFANKVVYEKKKEYNFDLDKEQLKKVKAQSLANARARFGARKKDSLVDITPEEWQAIDRGALKHSKVVEILKNTDKDKVRDYATPKTKKGVSSATQSLIKAYANRGYSQADIARQLGISVSTVNRVINE